MSGVIVVASASVGCARKRDLFHSIALRAEKFALTVERSRLIETAIDEIRRRQTPVPSDEALSQSQRAMTPAFARAFSDIWQAPGTRAPALRHHLLRESQWCSYD
ncbi:hypothetical protein [Caballeronia cordobensis]|uniref:hypothetical protein n=1 Tax=Caballeronia cordobensis TaxID=1353886 RepID=UPI000697BB4D